MDHTWYLSAANKGSQFISVASLIEDCSINAYLNDIRQLIKQADNRNYRFYDIKQNANEITVTCYFSENSDFDNFYKDCQKI